MTDPLTRFGIIGPRITRLKPDALFGNSIYSAKRDPSTTLIAIGGKAGLHKSAPAYSGDYRVPAKAARLRRVAIEIYLKINAPNIYGCIIR